MSLIITYPHKKCIELVCSSLRKLPLLNTASGGIYSFHVALELLDGYSELSTSQGTCLQYLFFFHFQYAVVKFIWKRDILVFSKNLDIEPIKKLITVSYYDINLQVL